MRTRDAIRAARRDGATAGHNAATWVFDGNTDDATYARVLRGLDEGDPAVYDAYNAPDLSGQWAGGETPASLAHTYGIAEGDERMDDVCSAWEDAAADAFWAEVERAARAHVGTATAA